jgi:hypothetical protein
VAGGLALATLKIVISHARSGGDDGEGAVLFAGGADGDLDVLAEGGEKFHEAGDGSWQTALRDQD